jgi:pimeloyl-ACP methyl ester carboxylesterase
LISHFKRPVRGKRFALFVLAFLGLALNGKAEGIAERPPEMPEGWSEGYVFANGIRMHFWRTGGDKPPLVMAHGSSDDGTCWTNLAKALEADFDIILPDARGHGLTDPGSKHDPADVQVEDLAGLIRELKLEDPIVMGHSMGSASAMWFAARYPDKLRALILEDPRLVPRSPNDPRRSTDPEKVEERRLRILERNNTPYAQLVSECLQTNPKWGLSECEYWAPSKRRFHPNNAYRRLNDRPSPSELFTKISVPTLILKADAEAEARRLDEAVASGLEVFRLVHVDGARHNVRRDQKQRVIEELRAFLRDL